MAKTRTFKGKTFNPQNYMNYFDFKELVHDFLTEQMKLPFATPGEEYKIYYVDKLEGEVFFEGTFLEACLFFKEYEAADLAIQKGLPLSNKDYEANLYIYDEERGGMIETFFDPYYACVLDTEMPAEISFSIARLAPRNSQPVSLRKLTYQVGVLNFDHLYKRYIENQIDLVWTELQCIGAEAPIFFENVILKGKEPSYLPPITAAGIIYVASYFWQDDEKRINKLMNKVLFDHYSVIRDEIAFIDLLKSSIPYLSKHQKAFERFKEYILLFGVRGIRFQYGLYFELLDELFRNGPLVDDDMMKRLLKLDKTLSHIVIMDSLDDVRILDDDYAIKIIEEYLSYEFNIKALIRTMEKGQYLVTEDRLYMLRDKLERKGTKEKRKNLEIFLAYYNENKEAY